jgi:hypothetical protein
VKPSWVLPALWLLATVGLVVASNQNWYQVIKPVPGLQKVVATGLESFPILATLPWLAVLCLALAWYLGSLGKILIGLLTAALSLAGATQILLQQTNYQVLIAKIEKHSGISEAITFVSNRTDVLGGKYFGLLALLGLGLVGISLALTAKRFPKRIIKGPDKTPNNKPDSQTLWDEQSN